jgi:hypothetical protein
MNRFICRSCLVANVLGWGILAAIPPLINPAMADPAVIAGAPVVTNVTAQQRPSTHLIDIGYDLYDADSDSLFVRLLFSSDGGASWTATYLSATGDVLRWVPAGTNRQIVWDAGADMPGVAFPACRIRVVADDEVPAPAIVNLRRLANARSDTLAFTPMDTIPYGAPFGFVWSGSSPATMIYPPLMLAQMDTVPPLDGILGYQYGSTTAECLGPPADCWQPRRFVEVTGDSVPFFGTHAGLWFNNDDSGTSLFRQRLASGVHQLRLNALDVNGAEVPESGRAFPFVINHDPQTLLLDGESDWAHPADPQTYPYYIQLNDPAQTRHPFQSGDRIPDRTYVVVKALGRDDPRDLRVNPGYQMGFTGTLLGIRQNLTGGQYPFMSEPSTLNTQPAWGAGTGGWYGDTLGFLTAPRTTYTIRMHSVDEHARQDGTPSALTFDVGYEPCLQCIELLPKPSTSLSAFDPNVACVESADPGYLATHPCLAGVTQLRVSAQSVPDPDPLRDLEAIPGTAYMLVGRSTGNLTTKATTPTHADSVANFVVVANRYKMALLLHGKDDPREAWSQPVRRTGGVQYQVSHACDPYNQIQDGGGNDNIGLPTWGQPTVGTGLVVNTATGLWKLEVEVYVPTHLVEWGVTNFRLVLNATVAAGDPQAVELIFAAVTRSFGDGWVDAIILDQTTCSSLPTRPATYNFFGNVRPSGTLVAGQTWRDCSLYLPQITQRLALSHGAMASLGGQPVRKYFRLTLNPGMGEDLVCSPE